MASTIASDTAGHNHGSPPAQGVDSVLAPTTPLAEAGAGHVDGRHAPAGHDACLRARLALGRDVLLAGPDNPDDGFGGWRHGVADWLADNGFSVCRAGSAPWSISVGPPAQAPAATQWRTLYTAIDETGLAQPDSLAQYDELWVSTPVQAERARGMGFVGPVAVVRPPLRWPTRVDPQSNYFVWVGTSQARKQRHVVEAWARDAGLEVIYIDRNARRLSRETYDSTLAGARGLLVASRDEGYSVPVREAAYAGIPVYGLPLAEYDGLVTPVAVAADILKPVPSLRQPPQIQSPLAPMMPRDVLGFCPARCRCGVQVHHSAICRALGIPVHDGAGAGRLMVSFHDFYKGDIFAYLPGRQLALVDIHSIWPEDRRRLAEYHAIQYVGHRANHIEGLRRAELLPLLTRAERTWCAKEPVIYHSGQICGLKDVALYFAAAALDAGSGYRWELDLSIGWFTAQEDIQRAAEQGAQAAANARAAGVDAEFRLTSYLPDPVRYERIERASCVCVLYRGRPPLQDASGLANDALYLRTPATVNENWIPEWDRWSVPWQEETPEGLLACVRQAREQAIPAVLPNDKASIIARYAELLEM